jgi:hypothetical protein
MAKDKQGSGGRQEKKLRRQLQRAEEAHIKAHQQLEAAQSRLTRAEARLARRAAALEAVRAELVTLAATPADVPVAPEAPPAVTLDEALPDVVVPPVEAAGSAAVEVAASDGDQAARPPRPRGGRRGARASEAPTTTLSLPPFDEPAPAAPASETAPASGTAPADPAAPLGVVVP